MIKYINKLQLILAFVFIGSSKILAQSIEPKAFAKALEQTPNVQLLDVRNPSEFAGGHLPKALNISVNDSLFVENARKLDKSKPVFVYCLAGKRSAKAAEILQKEGFTVTDMAGGYLKWSSEKLPTEGETKPKDKLGIYTVEDFKNILANNQLVLINYFATWCGPCKQMSPMLSKLEKEYHGKVTIVKIDTDKNKNLAIRNLVNELPTFTFYKKGKKIWSGAGLQDEDWFRDLFDLNLQKNNQ
jgi:thioredoxin 1